MTFNLNYFFSDIRYEKQYYFLAFIEKVTSTAANFNGLVPSEIFRRAELLQHLEPNGFRVLCSLSRSHRSEQANQPIPFQ